MSESEKRKKVAKAKKTKRATGTKKVSEGKLSVSAIGNGNKLSSKKLYVKWIEGKESQLKAACRNSYKDEDLARIIGCSVATLYRIKKVSKEVRAFFAVSREEADLLVEDALYKSVMGYIIEERTVSTSTDKDGNQTETVRTVTKHFQGSTTAQMFWLTNRKSDSWKRDRKESDKPNESGNTMTIEDVLAAVADSIGTHSANDYSGIEVAYKKSKLDVSDKDTGTDR